MYEALILIVLSVGVGLALASVRPEATKKWFQRIVAFRMIIGSIGGIAVALVFISSGVTFLVLSGFAILVYSTLYVLFERPHEVIAEWIPI